MMAMIAEELAWFEEGNEKIGLVTPKRQVEQNHGRDDWGNALASIAALSMIW